MRSFLYLYIITAGSWSTTWNCYFFNCKFTLVTAIIWSYLLKHSLRQIYVFTICKLPCRRNTRLIKYYRQQNRVIFLLVLREREKPSLCGGGNIHFRSQMKTGMTIRIILLFLLSEQWKKIPLKKSIHYLWFFCAKSLNKSTKTLSTINGSIYLYA